MKIRSQKIAILLNAFGMPGMGQFYLGRKLTGSLWMGMALVFLSGGLIRYMAVIFHLLAAHKHPGHSPSLNPLPVMKQAWAYDRSVLLAFLLGLFLIWLLAILDLIWKRTPSQRHGKSIGTT